MTNIKDIKILQRKNQDILELEKLKEETIKLKNKIKIFSTYNSNLISNIIVKLMTTFEGIEYCSSKNNTCFSDYDYLIEPKSNIYYIYPNYKIKNITSDKIQELLILLSNNNKRKQKILKK